MLIGVVPFHLPGLVVDLEEMHSWNPRLILLVGSHIRCTFQLVNQSIRRLLAHKLRFGIDEVNFSSP